MNQECLQNNMTRVPNTPNTFTDGRIERTEHGDQIIYGNTCMIQSKSEIEAILRLCGCDPSAMKK